MTGRLAVTLAVAALICSRSAAAQESGSGAQPGPQAAPQEGADRQSTSQQAPATPQGAASDAEKKKLEEEISRELGGGAAAAQPQPPPPAAAQGAPSSPQGTTGGNPLARLLLLPDISAIGSFAFAYDNYDVATQSPRSGPFGPADKPTFLFQELELGLQAVVDPYARADVFISFSPEGASVEEAYLTTLGLPAGLQIRAGQFFTPFGRQNQQHPHVWEFVDIPLPRTRLVANDVLSGPGVDVAWLAPLPWFAQLQVAAQSTAPDTLQPGETVPPTDAERLTGTARLLQYFSLGDATSLGVGLSAARRDEPGPGAFRDLGAVDAYLRIRPPTTRAYLQLQGEFFARHFHDAPNEPTGTDTGGYVQAFWRQDAYLGYGVRYDWAPSAGDAAPGTEQRASAVATWFATEFQRIRGQLAWDRRPGGQDGLELLVALEFVIGAHGAHPF
jgi:hypothetical protein